jgi:CobQ-like glutamine amidotransferase family enzyme
MAAKNVDNELTIVHLYRDEMNIYGDRGNVLTLAKRLEWRNVPHRVVDVGVGDAFDLTQADIIFAGGGQDRGQLTVGADLLERSENLHAAADAGVVMLTICGTYQLFGRFFQTVGGTKIPGIGIFGTETYASDKRMIGNIVIDTPWGELVGFENHSGQTELDEVQPPIGQVIKGYGNNESSMSLAPTCTGQFCPRTRISLIACWRLPSSAKIQAQRSRRLTTPSNSWRPRLRTSDRNSCYLSR